MLEKTFHARFLVSANQMHMIWEELHQYAIELFTGYHLSQTLIVATQRELL